MTTVQERLGQIRGEMQAAVELGNAVWLDDLRREQYALWQREQDDAHDRDAGAIGPRILDGATLVPNRELAAFHAEHEELVTARPLVDAVARYGAAAEVLDAYRRDGAIQPGQIDEFMRRIGELASLKNDARDALLDLARTTPDADVRHGR